MNKDFYNYKIGMLFQYLIVYFVFRPYYWLFFRLKVTGRENIPNNKSVILASNHSSYHDPPVLASFSKIPVAFMAKKELFDVPVLSQLISNLGAFPVNRQKLEKSTVKTAKHIVANTGWNLGIFPQGTRIMDGSLDHVKTGFSHLAKLAKATVVPVYIDIKKGKYPFYGKIIVNIGKPLPHSEDMDEITENWKKAVSELAGHHEQSNSKQCTPV